MTKKRQVLGRLGEMATANYLSQRGWRIIAQNYKTALGEVDLVVQKQDILAFVEVKTRSSNAFGEGYESVTWRKRQKLARLAELFLQQNKLNHKQVRFDVASVQVDQSSGQVASIEYWEHAFSC